MISTYVKRQLVVFTVLATAAALIIVFVYAHIPTVLGYGQMKFTAYFADGAGVYVNSNVTTRGVKIGKVTGVALTRQGVEVTMSVADDVKIGDDARAEIHSVSAVGEQYVDIVSPRAGGPYLADGAVIPLSRTAVPEQIAPVLDKATNLLASIPNDGLQTFLDEGYKAFYNLGPDLRTLVDSSQNLIDTADANYAQTAQFINTIGPLLDTQNVAANDVRSFWSDLADFTGVFRDEDPHFRGAIRNVRGAVDAVSDFLDDNENSAPILAHNLETVGQVLGVYRKGIEQVLVEYPIALAREQRGLQGPARGLRATATLSVYPTCSTGFQPQDLRNPNDWTDKEAVPGIYCKVPQNDPRVVRGARNIPCSEGKVGMRAATVDECLGRKPPQDTGHTPTVSPQLPTLNGPQRTPLNPPDNQTGEPGSEEPGSEPLQGIGGMGIPSSGKDETWQSLLAGPANR